MSTEADEYANTPPFLERDAGDDPIALFERWFAEAEAAEPSLPEAAALATCGPGGQPGCRVVLLKAIDAGGFVFYTNYASPKARALAHNPRATLLFHWKSLARQVRVAGRVEKVDAATSDAYFRTRPRASQLGAWASPQSEVVPDRAALDAALRQVEARFAGRKVPRPPHWGGYRLDPSAIEFWQGQVGRMHDRIRFRRAAEAWVRERLAP